MDNLNLNSDEAIIQKTQTIIINGIKHEAVLTSSRLILVESETGSIHEEFRFAEISRAISGLNKLREPVITLIINTPGGEERTIELIFIRSIGNQNITELEKCIVILKEHNVPIEARSQLTSYALLSQKERRNVGELVVEEQVSRPAVPEWTILGSSRDTRQSLPEEENPELSPLTTIAAIILVLAVFVIGATLMGQMLKEKTDPYDQHKNAPVVTSVVTIAPEPSPTPAPASEVTSVPAESLPLISIPATGVWVGVNYPGNFSGSIGARGTSMEVSGSGTKFYQLPVTDPSVYGSIAKQDGSADKMVVDIYKDGALIARRSTRSPFGVIDLVTTRSEAVTNEAVTNVAVMTLVPTPGSQAIKDYLPTISVPPTGVWVRVYYPGSYSGSVGGRGLFTPIKTTGDQLYNIPANVGIVEGSVEKDDGSVGKMIVEVYKDGGRISQAVTTTPHGLIDLHVPV